MHWYLDDDTFVGSRDDVSTLAKFIIDKAPNFGLHVNLQNCEDYWPSGNQTFPLFLQKSNMYCCRRTEQKFLDLQLVGVPASVMPFQAQRRQNLAGSRTFG